MNHILLSFLLASGAPMMATLPLATVQEQPADQFYIYKPGYGKEKKGYGSHTFITLDLSLFEERDKAPELLAEMLEKEAPDIFLAQEVPFESGLALFESLKNQYPHFWMGIGVKPGENESNLFAASKYPILSDPLFIPYPESSSQGFFCIETDQFWIVTTHLEHSSRDEQLYFLKNQMDQLTKESGKPYLLSGEAIDETSTIRGENLQVQVLEPFNDPFTYKVSFSLEEQRRG